MTFDSTIHVGELLIVLGAGFAVFKGGLGMRDAVRELAFMVSRMGETQTDHEDRLRTLESGDSPWPLNERRRHPRVKQ